jgi:hypothetical protein
MPHAKVFKQVGKSLTLRVLAKFLHFFLAQLDYFIDLRLGHDKRIKKIDTKERGGGSNGRWEDRAILTWFSTILTALIPSKAT